MLLSTLVRTMRHDALADNTLRIKQVLFDQLCGAAVTPMADAALAELVLPVVLAVVAPVAAPVVAPVVEVVAAVLAAAVAAHAAAVAAELRRSTAS